MELVARRSGIVSQLAPERGRGSAWMAGIGPDCLMTVLDLEVECRDLTSCGPGYFCLGIMSPVLPGNHAAARQRPRPCRSCHVPPGCRLLRLPAEAAHPHVSRSLCFTPRFWEQLAFDCRSDGDALLERFATAPQVLNAPHVGAMLQRLDALSGRRRGDRAAPDGACRRGRRLPHGYRRGRRTGRSRSGQQRSGPSGPRRPRAAGAPLGCAAHTGVHRPRTVREPLASGGHLQGRARARRGRGAAGPADGARPRASGRHGTSLCPRWAAPWAIRARQPSPPPSPARSAAPPPPGANSTASETALLRDPVVGPL